MRVKRLYEESVFEPLRYEDIRSLQSSLHLKDEKLGKVSVKVF